MGLIARLFNKTKKQTKEIKEILEFDKKLKSLLSDNCYISRNDYSGLIEEYKSTAEHFIALQKSQVLDIFCKKHSVKKELIESIINNYNVIKELIDKHNEEYIKYNIEKEKHYLDNILRDIDPNIKLDYDQKKAVLTDEDYCLIIAGAGAGKTTTVAAKVKYLVDKKAIEPKQILVISFTNKAVNELKERINDNLGIDCPITTFHSAGYAILRKQEEEKKKIVDSGFLYNVVNDYLKEKVLSHPETVDKLVLFFGSYFNAPFEGTDINIFFNYIVKADFSTLKSNINEYTEQIIDRKTNKRVSISNEFLKSRQEVKIANFLYLNGIDYEYEATYQYHILKAKKPYTPDFCIKQGDKVAYIEHFGITEDGKHNFYTPEELSKYKQEINDKIALHRKHNTPLIYTFASYKDGRDLLDHLREELEKKGFELNPRDPQKVFKKIIDNEENSYISRLVKLICIFISNFKTCGYNIDDFYRFKRMNSSVRSKLFLDVCKECYLEYAKRLSENNAVDFEDMINDSARILREKQIAKEKLDFKYIIVDEYQDISRQRFDLTKELSKLCNAKIIAVGDDWQSIYAFSGSDITLFTQFCKIMGHGKELKIAKTYRNAQEVIDIAGNFIQKNESQIKKTLIAQKNIQKPVIINTYSEEYDRKKYKGKGGKYFQLGKVVEKTIGQIIEANKVEGKNNDAKILLIGRYNFDARNLCFSKDFVYDDKNKKVFSKKYKNVKIEFLTAHSSKGLGYDNVIIINARNEFYGFPSKIDTDPVLQYVIKDDKSIDYAEERRLFYVALTRTKNRVYIVTPEQHPSEFILELIKDYPNVTLCGELNKDNEINVGMMKKCPICGYPLQYRYKKNYGLRLWICANDPEICSFISNDLRGEEMTIQKCDKCKDGYLVVKAKTNGEAMLGCTNYKSDGTGCDRSMNKDYYLKWINKGFENDCSVDKPSYREVVEIRTPKVIKPKRVEEYRSDKKADVNKTIFITHENFEVVGTEEGLIITDLVLLQDLKKLRKEIMKETKQPAYTIIETKGS